MTTKTIMNLVPTMSAVALVSDNMKGIPKKDGSGKDIRANRGRGGCETTKLVGQGMRNIVGTSLIKTQADLIAGM